MLFIIYLWMVYNVTGAGGLSDIIYAPRGGINNSIIKANINLEFLENGINTTFLSVSYTHLTLPTILRV